MRRKTDESAENRPADRGAVRTSGTIHSLCRVFSKKAGLHCRQSRRRSPLGVAESVGPIPGPRITGEPDGAPGEPVVEWGNWQHEVVVITIRQQYDGQPSSACRPDDLQPSN